MKLAKRGIKWFLIVLLFALGVLIAMDKYVSWQSSSKIYSRVEKVPAKQAALVLGTAKYIAKGKKNYFYVYRIRAAANLFKAGKVKAIIVSGDNATKYYDEPTKMKKDLIRAGVPSKYVTLDSAGFRTLDSIVRAKAVFGLDDYIIVSQKFHLKRALFIAQAKGQKAIGFAAKDIAGTKAAYRMKAREYLARAKAFLDLYILHKEPKFYGPEETVNYKEQ